MLPTIEASATPGPRWKRECRRDRPRVNRKRIFFQPHFDWIVRGCAAQHSNSSSLIHLRMQRSVSSQWEQ
jgi:hypothetical protein